MPTDVFGTLYWTHAIEIPMVDGVHPVLVAFLRTSEPGSWVADDMAPSDQFVQLFRRGTWRSKSGLFGGSQKLVPVVPTMPNCPRELIGVPMRLEVRMRPSPKCIMLTLVHWYCGPVPNGFWNTTIVGAFTPLIEREVQNLVAYLRDCFGWAELPEVLKRLPEPK